MSANLMMISGDTAILSGRRGAFLNTLSEFASHWDRIDVITPPVHGPKLAGDIDNVHFWPSPAPKVLLPNYVLGRARQLASARGYALLVSHDYGLYLNGLGAAMASSAIRVPYVSEIHHVEGFPRAADWRERLQPLLARAYVSFAKDRASAFRITNDVELRPLLSRWGVPEHKLLLLYSLYLDFDIFKPAPAQPLQYDAIFCGRLTPNKAPFLFLEAVALARQKLGRLRAAIVGAGPLGPKLKARARASALDAHFFDWVDSQIELANLYRRSRCLMCTSYSEGGPRVVAEALACGVPVVTTRVGLAGELVRDGENGFVVDWSAREMADRLCQIVADESLRRRMSAAAPEAVRRFEKSRVIREYAMGYQHLIVR